MCLGCTLDAAWFFLGGALDGAWLCIESTVIVTWIVEGPHMND